ncbi:hypothetical protein [Nitrosomonas sp.]|uniref:hypothetical protein n=1 Tax=Nitrosomonas sp. TaxID=42353 RepID=UPI0026033176|nr:hypothetical protein [Nitrosomonas sp.]
MDIELAKSPKPCGQHGRSAEKPTEHQHRLPPTLGFSMNSAPPSIAAKISVFAFGMLSLVGGWIIVLLGGFFHAPAKFSSSVIFVSVPSAAAMAMLQFTAGALALFWLCRLRFTTVSACLISLGVAFGLPALYLITQLRKHEHCGCHKNRSLPNWSFNRTRSGKAPWPLCAD